LGANDSYRQNLLVAIEMPPTHEASPAFNVTAWQFRMRSRMPY